MIYLNAGNLWTDTYLDKVIELNKKHKDVKVTSLFGSIAGLTPTARPIDRLPYRDWAFIDMYVAKARKNDIHIRYTLNQSCIGPLQMFNDNWESKLKEDVEELHNIGVDEWTVTSPLLITLLTDMFPDDFIEVSTIAEVSTPEDANRWMLLGADGVNLSTSINRDFSMIEAIAKTGITVCILANEACLFRCPFRRECYNLSSHNSGRSQELFEFYPFAWCNNIRILNPAEWLMSRLVLPQWMDLYKRLTKVNRFKIAYRTHPEEVALPILESYMNKMKTGNLLDLWPTIAHLGDTKEPKDVTYIPCEELGEKDFLYHFFKDGNTCLSRTCGVDCYYCQRTYDRIARAEDTD